jgi:hypothetical protein
MDQRDWGKVTTRGDMEVEMVWRAKHLRAPNWLLPARALGCSHLGSEHAGDSRRRRRTMELRSSTRPRSTGHDRRLTRRRRERL